MGPGPSELGSSRLDTGTAEALVHLVDIDAWSKLESSPSALQSFMATSAGTSGEFAAPVPDEIGNQTTGCLLGRRRCAGNYYYWDKHAKFGAVIRDRRACIV